MSKGINKAILLGRVGKVEKHEKQANLIVRLSLATGEKFKNKQGEMQENTEWHNVIFFGKLAEIVDKYVEKGSQIYVEGKIKTSKYTDKDGIERYSTQIVADNMQMCGVKTGEAKQEKAAPAPRSNIPRGYETDDNYFSDDIPF